MTIIGTKVHIEQKLKHNKKSLDHFLSIYEEYSKTKILIFFVIIISIEEYVFSVVNGPHFFVYKFSGTNTPKKIFLKIF